MKRKSRLLLVLAIVLLSTGAAAGTAFALDPEAVLTFASQANPLGELLVGY